MPLTSHRIANPLSLCRDVGHVARDCRRLRKKPKENNSNLPFCFLRLLHLFFHSPIRDEITLKFSFLRPQSLLCCWFKTWYKLPDIKLYWRWVCTPGGAIRQQHKRLSCVGLFTISPLCHRIRETIDVAITSDPIIRVHRIRPYACSPHLMHNDIYYCALGTCIKREQSTSNCLRSFFFSLASFLCRSDMFIWVKCCFNLFFYFGLNTSAEITNVMRVRYLLVYMLWSSHGGQWREARRV